MTIERSLSAIDNQSAVCHPRCAIRRPPCGTRPAACALSTWEIEMPSRREFIAGVGAAAVGSAFSSRSNAAQSFKPSVLTDEISQDLGHACEVAARDLGLVTFTIENELACNTATGAEAARLLGAVRERALMLNWDPGNAAARGEKAYPDGYAKLPKDRIGHLHCKDLVPVGNAGDGKTECAAMGKGMIDWTGQFRALRKDGYAGALSLETHWRGAGTPEASTRQSMAGMKELLRRAETT